MKRSLRLPWLALAGLLMLAGCGGGGGGSNLSSFDNQLSESYGRLSGALQSENISDLMQLVSTSYLQDGVTFDGFRATFASFFQNYSNVHANYSINSIVYDDNRNPLYANVNFDESITGQNLATGVRDTIDAGTREMVWRLENGVWRMYGDQRATAQSLDFHRSITGLLGFPTHAK